MEPSKSLMILRTSTVTNRIKQVTGDKGGGKVGARGGGMVRLATRKLQEGEAVSLGTENHR